MIDQEILIVAEQLAREAHKGQLRRDKKPYETHLERVAASLKSPIQKAIAWLHDTLEDTKLTERDMHLAGIPEPVVYAVQCLTHLPQVSYDEFISQVLDCPMAIPVKIADILDNLSDAPTPGQVKKYAAALKRLVL